MNQFGIKAQSRFDYIFNTNPAATSNPPIVNVTWLNALTGEVFICIDNTVNRNGWSSLYRDGATSNVPNDYLLAIPRLDCYLPSNNRPVISSSLLSVNHDYSFSFNINIMQDFSTTDYYYILCFNGIYDIAVTLTTSLVRFGIWDGTTYQPINFSIAGNVDTFLAGTILSNGSGNYTINFFDANGVLGSSVTATPEALSVSSVIACHPTATTHDFNGTIRNFRLYDRILTTDEIKLLSFL